ncbi:hypothetical protein Patl1_26042 [Pistacia atlantica]|uniref:Uncharacterized protein n=1 Tax=Pistacia atlantica TaxID=434234 RepID=A0ACC1AZ68_9ROSI|nr:hypothetical protein Patl1_26042 [Pistacia atlantica]
MGTLLMVGASDGIVFGVVLFKEEGGKAWRLLDFLFLECLQQMGALQVASVSGLVCDFSIGGFEMRGLGSLLLGF